MPVQAFNNVNLFYEEIGSGEPLVLVHGSWMDHHTWDQLASALAARFRVISYDRRGHSESERPSGQGSVHEDVADLAALIETLGLAPAHIIGNSFGGSIVLRLAIARPDLIRSVAAHEPPLPSLAVNESASAGEAEGSQSQVMAVIQLASSGEMEEAARRFWNGILGPGGWERVLTTDERKSYVNNCPTFLDEVMDPEAFTLDLGSLARFAGPTLLSSGSTSPPLFPRVVAAVCAAMKSAREHKFDGLGHIPHQTHPDEYLQVWTSFVEADAVES
jgi:pimeloyl-ACP methyl ester carboxylesterase